MSKRFILSDSDPGKLEYYLGVEISSLDENTLLLHQTAYARKIINNFKMNDCNPAKTQLPHDMNISLLDSPDEVDPTLQSEYRALVGSLMYLYQWTRPDLGFAVTFLSRYLHKPGEKHLQAELGIRYTRDMERLKRRDKKTKCVVYVVRR